MLYRAVKEESIKQKKKKKKRMTRMNTKTDAWLHRISIVLGVSMQIWGMWQLHTSIGNPSPFWLPAWLSVAFLSY